MIPNHSPPSEDERPTLAGPVVAPKIVTRGAVVILICVRIGFYGDAHSRWIAGARQELSPGRTYARWWLSGPGEQGKDVDRIITRVQERENKMDKSQVDETGHGDCLQRRSGRDH